ncbi:MAG: serine/threonine-protein kinase [Myxococcota bacterium]
MSDEATRLGEWILGPVLGAGEESSVHLSTHVDDPQRKAAIKVLGRHSREAIGRFRREAEILAELDNPHIVKVHTLDLEDRMPYLEMEYIPGPSLKRLLLDGPPKVSDALAWATQIGDALVYLHARGVHHRDLSTSNVVLHEGRVVLVDFGLAKPTHGEQITAVGSRFGSVATAPPEWIGNNPVEGAVWDIYAFGVVLHELLTGTEGFPSDPEEPDHVVAAKIMARKRELECLDPGEGFPEPLRALVRRLTARDPRDRPRTMADVREKLGAIRPPDTEPTRPMPPPRTLSEGYRQASLVGNVVTGMLAGGAIILLLAVLWRVLTGILR